MAASGTYVWVLSVHECIEEALERCGIVGDAINSSHRDSARRSLNLTFIDWQANGIHQWFMEQRSVTLTEDDATPAVDARMLDIVDMVLRRDGADTPMTAISRKDYLEIPDKTQTGRPDRYWVDRQATGPVLTLWPVPENSTDVIVFNQIRRAQDIAQSNAGTSEESPDVPHLAQDALIAQLARRLALKFAPKRYATLLAEERDSFKLMKGEDRERSEISMTIGRR